MLADDRLSRRAFAHRFHLTHLAFRQFCESAPIRDAVRVYFVADFAYHRPTSHNFLE